MSKPHKSYEEQLAILVSRGLAVDNRDKALHALAHHSYYRLFEPKSDWLRRLKKHLATLPAEFLPAMGFPADWHERAIWKHAL